MNWNEYFASIAEAVRKKSKDTSQVGAVLRGPGDEVLLTAYNGPPRRVQDLPERLSREPLPGHQTGAKYLFCSHAEENLIATAAKLGIRTNCCSVVTTHHPCAACARMMIQAGIVQIYVGPYTTRMHPEHVEAAKAMLDDAGVVLLPWTEETTR